jgi:exodeoxyribonuclease VII small subunit
MSKKNDKDSFDFESSLEELESLVEKLEKGDLPLEESLKEFERGIALTRNCQKELKEAEQKVRILTEQGDEEEFGEDDIV